MTYANMQVRVFARCGVMLSDLRYAFRKIIWKANIKIEMGGIASAASAEFKAGAVAPVFVES